MSGLSTQGSEGVMATATRTRPAEGDQCVEISDIGWKGYSTMLRILGDRGCPRMIYLDGSVQLVSPSYIHERLKDRFTTFMVGLFFGLGVDFVGAGQTTFRRRAKRGGVEADLSYYIASVGRVLGKKKIDLRVDPPPDLAIEVVYSHDASKAIEVYRRLGVPEVWVCTEESFEILALRQNGRYASVGVSLAFPMLKAEEIFDWVTRPETGTDLNWGRELQAWIREDLANRPRLQAPDAQ